MSMPKRNCDSGGRMSANSRENTAAVDEALGAFSSITDRMQGFLYRCRNDSAYTMLFMTSGIRALCGYEASEFIHNRYRTFVSITHPDDLSLVDAAVARALQTRSNWAIDYRLIRKEGGPIWIHEIGGGVFSDAGELLYLEGFVVSVDDRKNLEGENRALLEGIGNVSAQIVGETGAILGILRALKMLGINARIEAARSVGNGAGFDVVAQEITNLAASSAEAAQRIKRLMDDLQALLVRKERR
jgi:PAS domain S-box-containing protein